jgi:hypothetical protein
MSNLCKQSAFIQQYIGYLFHGNYSFVSAIKTKQIEENKVKKIHPNLSAVLNKSSKNIC